jgi:hypothetical protein
MSDPRTIWLSLEAYHAIVYFAPEVREQYPAAGLKGQWMGYFATRAAAMGPVSPEVVIATFYNFHPSMVRRAIPDAWTLSSPERVLQARYAVADGALRRQLGDNVASESVREAAELARAAALEADLVGRALFAGHAALPWPDEPHMVLWHAATLLREHRGDGHVACLVEANVDGCEAHVLQAARGVIDPVAQRAFRGWSEEEWAVAEERLRARGWLDSEAMFTETGRAVRDSIEDRTDELAADPYDALGNERCDQLTRTLQNVAAMMSGGAIPFPNPMGLQPAK